jgi:hypothetical protein
MYTGIKILIVWRIHVAVGLKLRVALVYFGRVPAGQAFGTRFFICPAG